MIRNPVLLPAAAHPHDATVADAAGGSIPPSHTPHIPASPPAPHTAASSALQVHEEPIPTHSFVTNLWLFTIKKFYDSAQKQKTNHPTQQPIQPNPSAIRISGKVGSDGYR